VLEWNLPKVIRAVTISGMKSPDREPQLPKGMVFWFGLYGDSGRTVMVGTKRTFGDMVWKLGDKFFMTIWHVGLSFCGTQSIEKTVKSALAYETDIADFHRPIRIRWSWLPQCISKRRILDCKLFAKDFELGH
jgi:hypothetical protein